MVTNRLCRSRPDILRWLSFSALLIFLNTQRSCIRSDEFECEEAAQHIADCCGSKTQLKCIYEHGSGGDCGHTILPDLDEDTSRCMRALPCAAVKAAGACEQYPRARDLATVLRANCPNAQKP